MEMEVGVESGKLAQTKGSSIDLANNAKTMRLRLRLHFFFHLRSSHELYE